MRWSSERGVHLLLVRRAFTRREVCANCRTHARRDLALAGLVARPRMQRVSALAAYFVPATKRMSGPKVPAADAPRKCSPGNDASKPAVSSGYPLITRSECSKSGPRYEQWEMSTR